MTVIVCVDDSMGMAFNNRRQSRDRILIEDIIKNLEGKSLLMSDYSESLFKNLEDKKVSPSYLQEAKEDDICFVEKEDLLPFLPKIDKIILYFWNRSYPFDTSFNIPLDGWIKVSEREFAGSSHEKITTEEYVKCRK